MKPLAYELKSQPFMDFDFYVDQNVLIPRPETEQLVEKAIEEIKNLKLKIKNLELLDLGTGSGCIAVSLAKYFSHVKITAVDSSPDALAVARKNAKIHNVYDRIEFIEGNLLEPLAGRKFDLIISNPPYIPSKDIETLDSGVKEWEPRKALDGGVDGLDYIRKLIQEGPEYLNPGGMLIFEMGYGQAEAIRRLCPGVEIIKDYAGIDRIAIKRVS
ncbi:peptide chain release factor N(5)-glutamine methyltransferase [Candidatus Margulisiibacteriota bacterium]